MWLIVASSLVSSSVGSLGSLVFVKFRLVWFSSLVGSLLSPSVSECSCVSWFVG